MVIVTYLAIIFASVTQSAAAKLYGRRSGDAATFNLVKAGTATALFALMAIGGFTLHLPTVLWGLAYGTSMAASMYAGYRALCLGPMAPTGMLVSFSVVLPLLWGLTVGKERLTPLQLPGLLLLLGAMLLVNADKLLRPREESTPQSRGGRYGLWLLFVGITFFCNGTGAILQKQYGVHYPEGYPREFMLFAMLLCAAVFGIRSSVRRGHGTEKSARGIGLGALAGVAMGLANYLTLVLAGLENASLLFPLISAGTLLGALLCGRLVLKEKLKANHYAALALGMLAIVFLKL